MADGWFRFYNTALEHPKVLTLTDAQFRAWIALLSAASKLGGVIPNTPALIAALLRRPVSKAMDLVHALLSAGLLDSADGGYAPHNWTNRQFKSDGDGAERVKRHRDRKCNVTSDVTCNVTDTVTCNGGCNGPETETETETEKKKLERKVTPSGRPPAAVSPLPEWIDPAVWEGFAEMRRRIRAPITPRAREKILEKLDEFRRKGADPNACLDQSTERAWRGVFEPKDDQNGRKQTKTAHDKLFDAAARLINEELGIGAGARPAEAGNDHHVADETGRPLLLA